MESLIRQDASTEIAIQTVLDSLDSPHSKRAYERHLREFPAWHHATGQALCKAAVQRYAAQFARIWVIGSNDQSTTLRDSQTR